MGGSTGRPDPEFQAAFDPLAPGSGATMQAVRHRGRTVHYLDKGDRSWRPMLFFGGLATSGLAFELTEFARTMRERLELRAIGVERNGLGRTRFDPTLGIGDAVDDVLRVLDHVGVERAAVVAFSGGGPYAAALAARAPDRLISLHLAAAAAGELIAGSAAARELAGNAAELARDPATLWRFPDDSAVHRIPGFVQAAAAEGARALGLDGRGARVLAHEWRLLCSSRLPSLDCVRAPAFLYWGAADEVVPPAHAAAWLEALGGVGTIRLYQGQAHDVQYRHWDQILLDAAGFGSRILICHRGCHALVSDVQLEPALREGATLGLCAWGG